MPAKLSPEQINRALQLQSRFWTHERIADELGVCRETVSRLLSRINSATLKRLLKRRAEIKARQVAQLEWMAEEAAEAWAQSRLDAEIRKTTETPAEGDNPAGERTELTVKGQSGNPSLLREAREALADVRAILGLEIEEPDEPAQHDFEIDLAPHDPPQQADGTSA